MQRLIAITVLALLSTGLVACGDAGADSNDSENTAGFGSDYGVDPLDYPVECRKTEVVERSESSWMNLDDSGSAEIELLHIFTPCREDREHCDRRHAPKYLYGEEAHNLTVSTDYSPDDETEYSVEEVEAVFQLKQDGSVLREQLVNSSLDAATEPEGAVWWDWAPAEGESWSADNITLAAQGVGKHSLWFDIEKTNHFIDPECVEAE